MGPPSADLAALHGPRAATSRAPLRAKLTTRRALADVGEPQVNAPRPPMGAPLAVATRLGRLSRLATRGRPQRTQLTGIATPGTPAAASGTAAAASKPEAMSEATSMRSAPSTTVYSADVLN